MDIMELLQGDSSLPTAWSTDADTLMDGRRLGIHARPAYTTGIPTGVNITQFVTDFSVLHCLTLCQYMKTEFLYCFP